MAATMITGSEALKKFCDDLLDTVERLRKELRKTEQAMDEVAEEWKDHQFKKYRDEFNEDKEQIEPLCKKIEEYEKDVLYPLYKIVYKYENIY